MWFTNFYFLLKINIIIKLYDSMAKMAKKLLEKYWKIIREQVREIYGHKFNFEIFVFSLKLVLLLLN